MYTIGYLCKKFNISRSTLLYYDTIDLLKPSYRTEKKYRLYTEEDIHILEQIFLFRQAGVPLENIRDIVYTHHNITDHILKKRLMDLNQEIKKCELQKQIIIQMLKNKQIPQDPPLTNKDAFVKVLQNAGLSEGEMEKLHMEFEKLYPSEHQSFLEFLGIPKEEIQLIRAHSRNLSSM